MSTAMQKQPSLVPNAKASIGKAPSIKPSGFEEFMMATAVPAPDDAVAPTKPPAVAVENVHKLATDYGIIFG